MKSQTGWEFYIDRGGTFTDIIGLGPDQTWHTYKVLSSDEAPLQGIRHILGLSSKDPIPPLTLKIGSTVGTNALLERKGQSLAFLVTKGFRDLLGIGYQNRPQLFDLAIQKQSPLYERVIEIEERMDSQGRVLQRPDMEKTKKLLSFLYHSGIRDIVILFLHSYKNPAHELLVGEWAKDVGFSNITLSHQSSNQIKAVARGDTAVLDGYLTPIIQKYLQYLKSHLPGSKLEVMASHGGLATVEQFRGKDSLLSGPAGGVVGYAKLAEKAGYPKVIGFDMGGTSTDVSRYDGKMEMVFESEKAGVRVQTPLVNIETVAAGGGSIIAFDGTRLLVGPESAGADPGPICYGKGGKELTLTDANLFLGRIQPKYFNKFPLQVEKVEKAFKELAHKISEKTGKKLTPHEVALGAIEIGNNNMASALEVISVAKGYHPGDYALCAFGGASGQHACAMARRLSMKTILIHPYSSLLSALGIGLADYKLFAEQTVQLEWNPLNLQKLEEEFQNLIHQIHEKMGGGKEWENHTLLPLVDMRYLGQSSTLTVEYEKENTPRNFETAHLQRFGYIQEGKTMEVVNIRIEAIGFGKTPPSIKVPPFNSELKPRDRVKVWFSEGPQETDLYFWKDLGEGQEISGPALVLDDDLTILVEPGFKAVLDKSGFLVLKELESSSLLEDPKKKENEEEEIEKDPLLLEVFFRHFASVAEQMGEALKNTAFSTNIKERLDFSCAVFDSSGELVANAAHIPVHLGAMSEAVKGLLEAKVPLEDGHVYVTNNPFCGGSHLPDVTVITPVMEENGQKPLFFVANRGHHADIGGITPGSMPPFSKTIEEEGVLIDHFLLVENHKPHYQEFLDLLQSAPYPARNLEERLSDIEAQVAANRKGVDLLKNLMEKHGQKKVLAYMKFMREMARERMEDLLESYPDGSYPFCDYLDDGTPIKVNIEIQGRRARIDFTGTGKQLKSNLNANPAITKSAILYVFRTLLNSPIPLNGGCLEPLEIYIPKGTLLNPEGMVPVVGGNVETSQRICDVLLGAMGALSASQGTMNNFTFGNESFGYYETIGGGAGAGDGFDGASGVHVHMTNTRMTDPEVLENRYPVLVEEMGLRNDKGGEGKWFGGRGMIRRIRFLEPLEVALLTERRSLAPYGLKGGNPGQKGENRIIRTLDNGKKMVSPLPAKFALTVAPGESIEILTPGGGGYGLLSERDLPLDPQNFRALLEKPSQWELQKFRNHIQNLRRAFSLGLYTGPTSGLAPGFIQANLVVVPKEIGKVFEEFCSLNPGPCPLLEALEPGNFEPLIYSHKGDIRTEIPMYRLFQQGKGWKKIKSLEPFWKDSLQAFLLGCSFSFEEALAKDGIPLRHWEDGKNVSMYITNIPCKKAGPLEGPMVVSMRPIPSDLVDRAWEITSHFPFGHGAPIHAGNPQEIGIMDLANPDFGDPPTFHKGDIPVFWACGVTPQVVLERSLPYFFSHYPGSMFITEVYAHPDKE
ncbi:MAG: putative hydro-lyase [Planctomycetota bacterium]|nr:MAG: putative hydro-lyase [Planctomycetota bacterium]